MPQFLDSIEILLAFVGHFAQAAISLSHVDMVSRFITGYTKDRKRGIDFKLLSA